MRKSVFGVLAVAVAAALALPGCARVPDSGPPVAEANRKLEGADLGVKEALVEPPAIGGPLDTVTLLLEAARTTQSQNLLSDAFLTTSAREAWKRGGHADVLVLRGARATLTAPATTANASVRLTATVVGTVNALGVYQVAEQRTLEQTLNLVRRDVWRIDSTLPGVMMKESDLAQAFQQVTLYFPAIDNGSSQAGGSGEVLVPDPRFVGRSNSRESAATSIVGLLLAGPSPWLLPVARQQVSKTKLNGNVTSQNSDLVADFSPEIEGSAPADINMFAAQIGWSLPTGVGGSLRLQVNGRDLSVDGVPAVQNADNWTRFNPYGGAKNSTLYYLFKGSLRKVVDQVGNPREPPPADTLGGPLARSGVTAAAVSLDESALAIVKGPPGKQTLYLGDMAGTLKAVATGAAIGRPTWGGSQDAVLVPIDGKLYQVEPSGKRAKLELPNSIGQLRAVRASFDGVRVALVAGDGPAPRAYIGLIDRTQDSAAPAVRNLRTVADPEAKVQDTPLVARAQDAGWSGPTTVAVAGQEADGTPQVRSATVDGALKPGPARSGLRTGAVTLAASPLTGVPQTEYVEVARQLFQGGQRSWSQLTALTDVQVPFYPG